MSVGWWLTCEHGAELRPTSTLVHPITSAAVWLWPVRGQIARNSVSASQRDEGTVTSIFQALPVAGLLQSNPAAGDMSTARTGTYQGLAARLSMGQRSQSRPASLGGLARVLPMAMA